MKVFTHPLFWLFFGFFGYPLVCVFAGLVGIEASRYWPKSGVSVFDWGIYTQGLLMGVPLGLVSAMTASSWRSGWFGTARVAAFLGGSIVGGFWLNFLMGFWQYIWLHDLGFDVPPLLWSLCLILFAFFARRPQTFSPNSHGPHST